MQDLFAVVNLFIRAYTDCGKLRKLLNLKRKISRTGSSQKNPQIILESGNYCSLKFYHKK